VHAHQVTVTGDIVARYGDIAGYAAHFLKRNLRSLHRQDGEDFSNASLRRIWAKRSLWATAFTNGPDAATANAEAVGGGGRLGRNAGRGRSRHDAAKARQALAAATETSQDYRGKAEAVRAFTELSSR
jgi:hypothetical protein